MFTYHNVHAQGYISGGKDGIVCLWDEAFGSCLKTYQLRSSAIEGGAQLYCDLPPIRALALGQGRILVGTKNSEVGVCCHDNQTMVCYRSLFCF